MQWKLQGGCSSTGVRSSMLLERPNAILESVLLLNMGMPKHIGKSFWKFAGNLKILNQINSGWRNGDADERANRTDEKGNSGGGG